MFFLPKTRLNSSKQMKDLNIFPDVILPQSPLQGRVVLREEGWEEGGKEIREKEDCNGSTVL